MRERKKILTHRTKGGAAGSARHASKIKLGVNNGNLSRINGVKFVLCREDLCTLDGDVVFTKNEQDVVHLAKSNTV